MAEKTATASAPASVAAAFAPVYEQGARKWIITITVICCALLELIDTSVVNVALTQLMGNLGATLSEVSWVIAAYGIANVIIVPMAGWLSLKFGRTRYFAASIILFTVASILCGTSTNIWELVFFRFMQGIGGGALLATSQSILFETFPPHERGLAGAMYGMGVVIGPTLGPTIGGYIVDNYDWPWIFFVNVPIGIIATILTIYYIKDPGYAKALRAKMRGIDFPGIFLLILGVGNLQMVLEQGEREDWFHTPYITVCTIAAVIGVVGFIWRELTAENPIVDLKVLKNPSLAIGTLLSFILGFGLFGSVFIIPVFSQQILGFTALQTGQMLIPGAIATGFMMPIVGRLIGAGVSQKIMIPIGFFLFFVFTVMLYNIITPFSGTDDFFYPLLVRGFGLGLIFVPLTTLSLSTLKGQEIAQGAGLTAMIRQLGGAFGVAILSTYLQVKAAGHRNDLLAYVGSGDPAVTSRLAGLKASFMSKGFDSLRATQQAYQALEGMLTRQAMMLTFMDVFLFLGMFFICCIPLVLLIRKGKAKISMDDAGH
ncbi:MAG: DHA2 family efflux MFS transporter permease subunit [Bacteroidota bacterium]